MANERIKVETIKKYLEGPGLDEIKTKTITVEEMQDMYMDGRLRYKDGINRDEIWSPAIYNLESYALGGELLENDNLLNEFEKEIEDIAEKYTAVASDVEQPSPPEETEELEEEKEESTMANNDVKNPQRRIIESYENKDDLRAQLEKAKSDGIEIVCSKIAEKYELRLDSMDLNEVTDKIWKHDLSVKNLIKNRENREAKIEATVEDVRTILDEFAELFKDDKAFDKKSFTYNGVAIVDNLKEFVNRPPEVRRAIIFENLRNKFGINFNKEVIEESSIGAPPPAGDTPHEIGSDIVGDPSSDDDVPPTKEDKSADSKPSPEENPELIAAAALAKLMKNIRYDTSLTGKEETIVFIYKDKNLAEYGFDGEAYKKASTSERLRMLNEATKKVDKELEKEEKVEKEATKKYMTVKDFVIMSVDYYNKTGGKAFDTFVLNDREFNLSDEKYRGLTGEELQNAVLEECKSWILKSHGKTFEEREALMKEEVKERGERKEERKDEGEAPSRTDERAERGEEGAEGAGSTPKPPKEDIHELITRLTNKNKEVAKEELEKEYTKKQLGNESNRLYKEILDLTDDEFKSNDKEKCLRIRKEKRDKFIANYKVYRTVLQFEEAIKLGDKEKEDVLRGSLEGLGAKAIEDAFEQQRKLQLITLYDEISDEDSHFQQEIRGLEIYRELGEKNALLQEARKKLEEKRKVADKAKELRATNGISESDKISDERVEMARAAETYWANKRNKRYLEQLTAIIPNLLVIRKVDKTMDNSIYGQIAKQIEGGYDPDKRGIKYNDIILDELAKHIGMAYAVFKEDADFAEMIEEAKAKVQGEDKPNIETDSDISEPEEGTDRGTTDTPPASDESHEPIEDAVSEEDKKAEEEALRKEEEAERKAKEAEEARKAKEAEEARKAKEAEEARKAKEAEEARKAKEAEDAKKKVTLEEVRDSYYNNSQKVAFDKFTKLASIEEAKIDKDLDFSRAKLKEVLAYMMARDHIVELNNKLEEKMQALKKTQALGERVDKRSGIRYNTFEVDAEPLKKEVEEISKQLNAFSEKYNEPEKATSLGKSAAYAIALSKTFHDKLENKPIDGLSEEEMEYLISLKEKSKDKSKGKDNDR